MAEVFHAIMLQRTLPLRGGAKCIIPDTFPPIPQSVLGLFQSNSVPGSMLPLVKRLPLYLQLKERVIEGNHLSVYINQVFLQERFLDRLYVGR